MQGQGWLQIFWQVLQIAGVSWFPVLKLIPPLQATSLQSLLRRQRGPGSSKKEMWAPGIVAGRVVLRTRTSSLLFRALARSFESRTEAYPVKTPVDLIPFLRGLALRKAALLLR